MLGKMLQLDWALICFCHQPCAQIWFSETTPRIWSKYFGNKNHGWHVSRKRNTNPNHQLWQNPYRVYLRGPVMPKTGNNGCLFRRLWANFSFFSASEKAWCWFSLKERFGTEIQVILKSVESQSAVPYQSSSSLMAFPLLKYPTVHIQNLLLMFVV